MKPSAFTKPHGLRVFTKEHIDGALNGQLYIIMHTARQTTRAPVLATKIPVCSGLSCFFPESVVEK